MEISPDIVKTVLGVLTGGGLIALITQGVRGWQVIRSGSRVTTRAVVKDLRDDRNDAETRLDLRTAQMEYWRDLAGDYAWQLRKHGHTPDPARADPPRPPAQPPARRSDDYRTDAEPDERNRDRL